jgi:DNA-directed RNA polymerase specialized sigma24 family protein
MDTCLELPASITGVLNSDIIWDTLYPLLLRLVKRWVYASNIISWIGQETDIAWDIVLTTIKRTYEYALKAERAGIAIASLERFSIVIAKNCFLDLRRKDSRLLHFDRDNYLKAEQSLSDNEVDQSEAVLEKVYEEWLFAELAKHIASFPPKMRTALLVDLASRMAFDEVNSNPTPLQRAFLEVGIQLQDFQRLLPTDPAAKARYASLVSLGYKRIAKSICIH